MKSKSNIQGLLDFIDESPSVYHVVENLRKKYEDAGFSEWKEQEEWKAQAGGKYYVIRGGSSIIGIEIPKEVSGIRGFHIAASHSDSPTFKIKENPDIEVEGCYHKLNIEKYGGMILSTWFDRPLSIAGRIFVETKQGIEQRLVNLDKDFCIIPSLAVHMNREVNKGMEYNVQNDMLPLYSVGEECDVLNIFAEQEKVSKENILGHDLYLYVRQKGSILGAEGELVCARGLDDLQCVYMCTEGFLSESPKEYINVNAVFDNEEVGSKTKQGADSTFLNEVLERVTDAIRQSEDGRFYERWMAGSFLISADNAHGVHPNYQAKSDPTNRPVLNGGIVLKYSANQKYTTDGESAAYFKLLCKKAEVKCQTYVNRSDMLGGSTLGNLLAAHLHIKAADVGLPQLAMHSAYETAGTKDLEMGIKVLKKYYAQ